MSPPKGSPLLNQIPKKEDPWENDYNYAYPGAPGAKGFDLWARVKTVSRVATMTSVTGKSPPSSCHGASPLAHQRQGFALID